MINVRLKKFLSSTVAGALSLASVNITSFSSVKAIDLDIPKAAEVGTKALLGDEKVQKVLENIAGLLEKLDPNDIKDIKDSGVKFLNDVRRASEEPLKKVNKILDVFGWILKGGLTMVGISVFNKAVNVVKGALGFGKVNRNEFTYNDCLQKIEEVIRALPINEVIKISMASSLLNQLSMKRVLNCKVGDGLKTGLVVLAGCGNSLVMENLSSGIRNKFGGINLPVYFEKVSSKVVTPHSFFEKIDRALSGLGEYKDKNGILILDFDGPAIAADDIKDLSVKILGCLILFEKVSKGSSAVNLLKNNIENYKPFFDARGVNVVLSKRLLSGVYNGFSEKEESEIFAGVSDLVNKITRAIYAFLVSAGIDKKPLIGGPVNVVLDLNRNNEVVIYRDL